MKTITMNASAINLFVESSTVQKRVQINSKI